MSNKKQLHVAIVPDGNRRWARKNMLEVWKGHERGAQRLQELSRAAFNAGVTHLSLWGSSLDNLTKRPESERHALLEVYKQSLQNMLDKGQREDMAARVRVIGRWNELFPQELKALIQKLETKTAHYTERTIIVFLAYSGDDEMIDAIQRMVNDSAEVSRESLKKYLWTRDIPPVDLLIRTGGEPHLSAGFLMWDMANAFLHFTNTLFPDFTPKMLTEAVTTFSSRTRRFGK